MKHTRVALFFICLLISVLAGCDGHKSLKDKNKPGDTVYGLDQRPQNSLCMAPKRPGDTVAGLALTDAIVDDNMRGLLDLVRGPVQYPSWWGIKQDGQVFVLPDGGASQEVLNSANLQGLTSGGELGLLGMSVEPHYDVAKADLTADQFRIYIYYTSDNCNLDPAPELCSRLSRFVITATATGFSAGVEESLLEVTQFEANHNGGAVRFGLDKLLYVTLGDGGSGGDPACAGQNLQSPLGKLLRLDVNTQTGYAIPADNPFAGNALCSRHAGIGTSGTPDTSRNGAACPEIYAYGLRNPFRMSFDRVTGALWIGDVGQDEVEEIDRLDTSVAAPNYNFGWPLREGPDERSNGACSKIQDINNEFTPPVFYARHSDNGPRGVMVGGIVYRGKALDSTYQGQYFFHDAQSGEHWRMANPYAASNQDVNGMNHTAFSAAAYGFTEDDNGEILLLAVGDAPKRIIQGTAEPYTFPPTLADTGCFSPGLPAQPVNGLIPYTVNSPLWSDGAAKERFFAIPDGTKIDVDAHGDFQFPIGSVLFKTFRTPEGALLETRMLVRHSDGDWGAYAYVWNEQGTDASLTDGETPIPRHHWTVPSRAQCFSCHTVATGRNIGLETAQLNGDMLYPSTARVANQLDTLNHIGLFNGVVQSAQQPALVDPKADGVDLEQAARSYLHANCAHCHQPANDINAIMDLRYFTAKNDTHLCNGLPWDGQKWAADVRLLVPGRPDQSLIVMRPGFVNEDRMPPVGTKIVDTRGVSLMQNWVTAVVCP